MVPSARRGRRMCAGLALWQDTRSDGWPTAGSERRTALPTGGRAGRWDAAASFLCTEIPAAETQEDMKMKRSVDRILTTHTGSLPRPPDLVELIFAREEGQDV